MFTTKLNLTLCSPERLEWVLLSGTNNDFLILFLQLKAELTLLPDYCVVILFLSLEERQSPNFERSQTKEQCSANSKGFS